MRRQCCELAGVIDGITSGGDSDVVEIFFLGGVVYNHSGICDNAVLWDIRCVLWGHDGNCSGPFLSCFIVALTHAVEVFPKNAVIQTSAVSGSFMRCL